MSARRLRAQAGMELRLAVRNGENLLVTLGIPLGLLVFFSRVPVLPTGGYRPLDFLVPGILALSVIASAMVSLGIATGFERSYLVLKRLGATPLRRSELVGAKLAAVLGVLALQVGVVVATALTLGWRPGPTWAPGLAVTGLLLGTAAFAGIGLALAGRLRALGALAVLNGLFVVLLLASGIVFPLDELPASVASGARLLPSAALADVLRTAFDARPGELALRTLASPWRAAREPLLVLAAWALAAPLAAARLFRWE